MRFREIKNNKKNGKSVKSTVGSLLEELKEFI